MRDFGETHGMVKIKEQDEVSVFRVNARTNSRHPGYESSAVRVMHRLLYGAAPVSHAMRHRNRVQDTSWQSQGENWRVRIADIVNTPVKPRVCESRMRAWRNVERGLTPI